MIANAICHHKGQIFTEQLMEGSIRYVIHGISGLTGRPCYAAQSGCFHTHTYEKAPTFDYERAKEIVNDLASRRFTEPYPQFGPRTCARLIKARLKMFGGKYGYGLPLKTEDNIFKSSL